MRGLGFWTWWHETLVETFTSSSPGRGANTTLLDFLLLAFTPRSFEGDFIARVVLEFSEVDAGSTEVDFNADIGLADFGNLLSIVLTLALFVRSQRNSSLKDIISPGWAFKYVSLSLD